MNLLFTLPLFNLSLCVAGGLNPVVWLTLIFPFCTALPYCRFKKQPKKRKPAAFFLLFWSPGQGTVLQPPPHSCTNTCSSSVCPPPVLLPLWKWECATQEFLPLWSRPFLRLGVLQISADGGGKSMLAALMIVTPAMPCDTVIFILMSGMWSGTENSSMFLSPSSSQMKTPWISLLACCAQGLKMPRTLPVECAS